VVKETVIDHPNWCKVAEVELIQKTKIKASERPHISCYRDSFNILRHTWTITKLTYRSSLKS